MSLGQKAMLSSLAGLSVGDALGQEFFANRGEPEPLVRERNLPASPWAWSDDTVMAVSLVEVLSVHGHVDQDALAEAFGKRFLSDMERGYGPMAYWLLHQIGGGQPWREVSPSVFSGQGSLGNGSAMRVAPLGALFHEDYERVATEAQASSEVTHFHQDGIAGAVAVALCTAELVRGGLQEDPGAALERILARTPAGETRSGLEKALGLLDAEPAAAARELGDGRLVRSSDTVPFGIWCALKCPSDFEEAIWLALAGLLDPASDRDTVLAIVGGIVGALEPAPEAWLRAREPLPAYSTSR